MQKFFCSPGLRYSTSGSGTPGVAYQRAAGSISSLRWPKPRASSLASSLAQSVSAGGGVFAFIVDAQATTEVDVLQGNACVFDQLHQVEHAVHGVQ